MSDQTENPGSDDDLLRMTADVVTAYVGNNTVAPSDLAEVIRTVHASLTEAQAGTAAAAAPPPKPAVPIKKSITPDYLICLEDGRELKMLKRHLRTTYNMTPDEYRAKWGLDADYPMVAPNYARRRSEFAKQIGLGQKRRKTETSESDMASAEGAASSTGGGGSH
ncbi:MAG: MucR family transcriptional regulator [Rhodospirillales bacterium]|nr:MucR family transcriptional regulator [Rhodospirillales bacterium]